MSGFWNVHIGSISEINRETSVERKDHENYCLVVRVEG